MSAIQRIVIVGATSRIAEHCARLWADQIPAAFVLIGRNSVKLHAIAQDLRVRGKSSTVDAIVANFESPEAIQELTRRVAGQGAIDIVLIAHGVLPEQLRCERDLVYEYQALVVNGVSPVLFAEGFAEPMVAAGKGTIAIIGSVAGDRGRKSNYVYGSAKGLIERYVQGLQHRLAGSAVKAVLIKPGPTDTPMTDKVKAAGGRVADVSIVARDIIAGIAAGKRQVYTPRAWRLIMLVVRCIPSRIFEKMNL